MQRLWRIALTIINVVFLQPLRQVSNLFFPGSELDGLAPAVTAKAAQQCVNYLCSLALATNQRTIHTNNNSTASNTTNVSANANASATFSTITNNNNNNGSVSTALIQSAWSSASGFAALKQQAVATQSLIFVYLHAPLHSQSKQFCVQVLNQPPFLTWLAPAAAAAAAAVNGPDHHHHNSRMVLATAYSIHSAQGAQLQTMLQVTAFPAIAVLQPGPPPSAAANANNNNASSSVLHLVLLEQGAALFGMDSDRLVLLLQAVQQRHFNVLAEYEVRRLQRQQESDLRRQQDDEYQATLAMDQERDRAVEQEKTVLLMAAAAELEEQEQRTRAAEQELQAARDLVVPEPEPDSGGTMIRFCLPSGAKINRRFASHQTVAALRAYLKVYFTENNIEIANVGLSTNFPRKSFSNEQDGALTLEAAGLTPQAVLMVQDLDA